MAYHALFIVLFSTFVFVSSTLVNHRNCSDGTTNRAVNVTVDVSDCDNPDNCTLVKGTTHFLTTTFTPTISTNTLLLQIWGLKGRMRLPHGRSKAICTEATVAEDGSTCGDSGGLVSGRRYTHVASFPVRRIYPEMSLVVRVLYYENRRNKILCFEVPVHIVEAPESD